MYLLHKRPEIPSDSCN